VEEWDYQKILLAEDDPVTRQSIRLLLEQEGLDVAVASDGGEALRYLRENGPPHLILLDLSMPGMDGWGFMDALTRRPTWLGVPVIVLTGASDVTADDVRDLGADDLIRKPIDADELLATVSRYAWAGA
jgi:two-component system, sensor histidine kinase and response regulator